MRKTTRAGAVVVGFLLGAAAPWAGADEVGNPMYDDRVYGETPETYRGTGAPETVPAERLERALLEIEAVRAALTEALQENVMLRRELTAARAEIERLRSERTAALRSERRAARTYTVRRGDTLGSIAARELGDSGRWREIYNANRDVVSNPHRIKPGMVLRLP